MWIPGPVQDWASSIDYFLVDFEVVLAAGAAGSSGSIADCNSLPAVNLTRLPAGIWIFSRVRGLSSFFHARPHPGRRMNQSQSIECLPRTVRLRGRHQKASRCACASFWVDSVFSLRRLTRSALPNMCRISSRFRAIVSYLLTLLSSISKDPLVILVYHRKVLVCLPILP